MFRRLFHFCLLMLPLNSLLAQNSSPPAELILPPSLSASGTGVIVENNSWGYVVWQATDPAWYEKNDVAVWLKPGDANAAAPFVLQGTMTTLTDPTAIFPWIKRAEKLAAATGDLAENFFVVATNSANLITQWSPTPNPVPPAALPERLSVLGVRARQEPGAAAALRALGQSHPMFRFVAGSGWAGPLGVPVGQDATIELREVSRQTGIEGAVVARVTLRAVALADTRMSPDLVIAPGQVVQVLPDWSNILPAIETAWNIPSTTLPDLAPALRWSIPEEMRRQILLTRGFMIWRSNVTNSYTSIIPHLSGFGLKKILRNPAAASKVFKGLDGVGSGPQVDEFLTDRTTWFVADDNNRYNFVVKPPAGQTPAFTGVAHLPNIPVYYNIAAVDLLGRYGPLAPAKSAVPLRTLPPVVPKVMRVENVVSNGNQRLRVTIKTNLNAPNDVPTTRYLVFRDRLRNTDPATNSLDRSIDPDENNQMIYVGQVLQPANPATQREITFIDESLAPTLPQHYGQTYYYCVRAASQVAQGYNISPPSPPAFGTVRDREGPPAPTGFIVSETPRAGINFSPDAGPAPVFDSKILPQSALLRLQIERLDRGISFLKVRIRSKLADGSGDVSSVERTLPDLHFGKSGVISFDYPIGLNDRSSTTVGIVITPVTAAGRIGRSLDFSRALSDFEEHKIYVNRFQTKSGMLMEMDPQNDFTWAGYFLRFDGTPIAQSFSSTYTSDGTFSATFPGAINFARARSLLIQYRSSNLGVWRNVATARLPQSSSQFVFRSAFIINAQFRVWEVFDRIDEVTSPYAYHQLTTGNGSIRTPIHIGLNLPVGTYEYRLYRRIDNGPLFLLKQDTGTWDPATVKTTVFDDGLLPTAGGSISYFGQTFDQHGNPGPLALLDQKVGQYPDLPVPVVDALESSGTPADPTMRVRASCPSPGVERMEILVTPTPESTVNLVVLAKPDGKLFNFKPGGAPSVPQDFASTVATAGLFNPDPNIPIVYEKDVRIKTGVEYTFQIRALGRFGPEGEWSSEQKFTWTAPLTGAAVPWPARPIPPRLTWASQVLAFIPGPEAYRFYFAANSQRIRYDTTIEGRPVAIQIGSVPLKDQLPEQDAANSNWEIFGATIGDTTQVGTFALRDIPGFIGGTGPDNLLEQFVARKEVLVGDIPSFDFDRNLLPVVLYRQQTHRRIAGVLNTVVGADLVQVSPMIRTIAWRPVGNYVRNNQTFSNYVYFDDPYVGVVVRNSPLPTTNPSLALCLYDTAPMASGARYRYFLAHFDKAFEIDGIIDAGVVQLPEEP